VLGLPSGRLLVGTAKEVDTKPSKAAIQAVLKILRYIVG